VREGLSTFTSPHNCGNVKNELTRREYWEQNYQGLDTGAPALDLDDFRQLPERRIVEAARGLGLAGKRVLEIGAGNSSILLALASAPEPGASFSGLDYAEAGCASLQQRARRQNIEVGVIHADMFAPDPALLGQFDVVYSLGVVEHFKDLTATMDKLALFLAPGGRMLTVIPNMRGLLGWLTRRFNRRVYDLHNPHDLASLVDGHKRAGLEVLESGYLCSNNFGLLASCIERPAGLRWHAYTLLSRFSKLSWYLESRWGEAPKSGWLSPYLYVVTTRPAAIQPAS
jgi:2-polyprenyl-3-methyl-5-hydroxy-6-metoxy-1,4-benzoquinol methylase